MSMDIWSLCGEQVEFERLTLEPWRSIDSRRFPGSSAALSQITDSLVEQLHLETILDNYPIRHLRESPEEEDNCGSLHPVFEGAFKNPILDYPSRFGTIYEKAIWYGSLEKETAFAETAYYLFYFLSGSDSSQENFEKNYTLYQIRTNESSSINCSEGQFSPFQDRISSPVEYEASQTLGTRMRENNAEMFIFPSARRVNGRNLGVFNPDVFCHQEPNSIESWRAEIQPNHGIIRFIQTNPVGLGVIEFQKNMFVVNGDIPHPAR